MPVCATQLAEISVLLAAVPAPAMPDAVAQRLEGVLAAEAAKDMIPNGPWSQRPATGRPARGRAGTGISGWSTLRVLAPAAAVVVLAAGGYGLSRIGGSSTSSAAGPASAAASAGRAGGAAPRPRRGRDSPPSAVPADRGAGPPSGS